MKGKVSFEGIGEVCATFYAGDGVKAGQVVKVSGDAEVASCAAGERFCGVAVSAKDGCAAVQVKGMAAVKCGGSVSAGYAKLSADGDGGVKADEAGEEFLVVSVDGDTAYVVL